MDDLLHISHIRTGYRKKEILKDVSIRVNKGEILAIIGPNGAGKSTLLKAIAGLLPLWEGKIMFNEEDITSLSCRERVKKGIVYFMQGGEIFPSLTIRENLEIGGLNLPHDKISKALDNIFTLFPELKTMSSKRAGLLSGGERQMTALGLAMMKDPEILLLDEPSAGLSPMIVNDLSEKISKIHSTNNTTIILVEQNISQAMSICSRVYLLKNGKITSEENSIDNLRVEKKYEILFFS